MANQQLPQVPMQGQGAPVQQQQPAQANPPLGLAVMLARRERSAPFFDNTQPEELSRSCIRKENHFQLILQHAAYHQIKGFDFAYNYKTTFNFLYM